MVLDGECCGVGESAESECAGLGEWVGGSIWANSHEKHGDGEHPGGVSRICEDITVQQDLLRVWRL